MNRVFPWLVRLTTAALVLALIVIGFVYFVVSRSLPDYDRTVAVEGLTAPVEILRDTANVPHIFGETDEDSYFGLGYAHAQDRLWQMTMLRRTAQGKLSELFGAATVEIDEVLRRLDIYTLATQSVSAQTPEAMAALNAYSAGVNARLAEINRGALGRGAPEFFLFEPSIAPWQPADSIAIQKIMALQLAAHLENEVLRARTSLVLENDRLQDLMPAAPGAGVAALPDYASIVPGVLPHIQGQRAELGWLSPFRSRELASASNAWAASTARSASGGTLLASDPHLGLTAPSIWYLARLELSHGGIIGGTIPGLPVVLSGRSAQLGWGVTSAYVDDQDVFIEEVNPDNPEQYRTPDGWADFRTRQSIIQIKDSDPLTLTLRWTENGPVLSGRQFDLATVTPPGHVASVSWTVLSPRDTSISSAIAINHATTIDEVIAAGEGYISPAQNLTVADTTSVALKTIGAIPARDAAHQSQGRIPSLGWVRANRWQGRQPYSSNPEVRAPEGGILGNTNNKIVDRPFPDHVSFVYGDTQRVQRWQRLMQSRAIHTRESFIEAQLDTVSPTARNLLPLVGAELWFTGEAAVPGTPLARRQEALSLLAEWNGEMNEHLPEPLLYAAWMRALQDRMIRDDLGPLADEFTHVEPLFIERAFRDINGAAAWCDVVQSAVAETCADMARLALDDALIWVQDVFGAAEIGSLRWGDAHQAMHDHEVLGELPVLRWFVNIRQSTSGGDNTLLRAKTRGTGRNPFVNVHAAGYRGVYDFADPDSSVFVISTGQSGHPLSRHYDDMGELWRRGEYVPMSLNPELARAAAIGVTTLVPE
ncbi:penicillin acylase family protein [Shimia ponticola]|uniref:penicillin acylase family protein n=1 Tax=Shimia ponticola TaxID=2582893 RepID=UPI0011BED1F1|nr:penicillin acylase family protein [Shimia ponticola]